MRFRAMSNTEEDEESGSEPIPTKPPMSIVSATSTPTFSIGKPPQSPS